MSNNNDNNDNNNNNDNNDKNDNKDIKEINTTIDRITDNFNLRQNTIFVHIYESLNTIADLCLIVIEYDWDLSSFCQNVIKNNRAKIEQNKAWIFSAGHYQFCAAFPNETIQVALHGYNYGQF